jgi:hypothetical protein
MQFYLKGPVRRPQLLQGHLDLWLTSKIVTMES